MCYTGYSAERGSTDYLRIDDVLLGQQKGLFVTRLIMGLCKQVEATILNIFKVFPMDPPPPHPPFVNTSSTSRSKRGVARGRN